jgi:hypothetical protein
VIGYPHVHEEIAGTSATLPNRTLACESQRLATIDTGRNFNWI